jgi:hypothetical protein
MRLERTKRYAAALLCAGGLSLFGNTLWADSDSGSGTTFTWIMGDGSSQQVDEQEARNRCTQCQQQGNNSNFNCAGNTQVCANFSIVIAPTVTVGP